MNPPKNTHLLQNVVNISMEEIATPHVDIVEVMLLVTVSLVTAPGDVRTIGRVTGATVRIQ